MSFIAAAAVSGGAAIGGAYLQSRSAKKAAQKQADSVAYAAAVQKQMFDQQRADQEPWRQAGVGALSELGNSDFKRDFTANDFQADPGYAFRMAEGQKALERSAAARGGLQSAGTMKALARYGQDTASAEYGNAYNRFNADRDRRFGRLSSIAGMGQGATNQMGAAAQNYGNTVSQNAIGLGNALGASQIAQGNAWSGALSGVASAGMQGATMSQNQKWMDQWAKNQTIQPTMAGQPSSYGKVYG